MRRHVVRYANKADAAAACETVRRSIADLCVEDHRGDESTLAAWLENKTVENVASWIDSDRHVALVAEDAFGVTGFALLNRDGKVALLYVSPRVRLQGVSKALLARLEREAVALGIREIGLTSTSTARRFYESCGYVSAGERQKGFGITGSYPMIKKIAT